MTLNETISAVRSRAFYSPKVYQKRIRGITVMGLDEIDTNTPNDKHCHGSLGACKCAFSIVALASQERTEHLVAHLIGLVAFIGQLHCFYVDVPGKLFQSLGLAFLNHIVRIEQQGQFPLRPESGYY